MKKTDKQLLFEKMEYLNPDFRVNEENNKNIYYHGRRNTSPFLGKYIYLTDDFHYAMQFSDFKVVYSYKLNFGEDKIFTKNELDKLSEYVDPQCLDSIMNSSSGDEIDWASFGCIWMEDPNTGEELDEEETLQHFGYKGIKLQERPEVTSLLIFSENDVTLVDKINITDEHKIKHNELAKEFEKKYNAHAGL